MRGRRISMTVGPIRGDQECMIPEATPHCFRHRNVQGMIVSVHIPKTAGSSFREGLERRLGGRLLADYEDRPLSDSISDRWRRLKTRIEVRYRAHDLAAKYAAVHGHFIATKYLPLGDRAAFCAFFRNPVERLLSQYRFWSRTPDPQNTMWVEFDALRMTPAQFAALPGQRKLYRLFTGGLPMERFAFVGITEEYETSLRLFRAVFGIDVPSRRVNVDAQTRESLDRREYEAVSAAQRTNSAIYDAARRRFDILYRQYLQSG